MVHDTYEASNKCQPSVVTEVLTAAVVRLKDLANKTVQTIKFKFQISQEYFQYKSVLNIHGWL